MGIPGDQLLRPQRLVRLRLMSGPAILEHLVYCCGPDAEPISGTNQGDKLWVRDPAPLAAILEGFVEYWGASNLVSSALKLKLDPEGALTLAALADLHRRQILGDRAAMQPSSLRFFTPQEIVKAMDGTAPDGQWLVITMKKLTGVGSSPNPVEVTAHLDHPAAQGVVQQQEGAWALDGDARACFNSFLLVSQVLRLEVHAQESPEKVVNSHLLCLQAGMHDNLSLERVDDDVLLEAVSSRLVSEMVETFLTPGPEMHQVLAGG